MADYYVNRKLWDTWSSPKLLQQAPNGFKLVLPKLAVLKQAWLGCLQRAIGYSNSADQLAHEGSYSETNYLSCIYVHPSI